jgi:hypothetical protein
VFVYFADWRCKFINCLNAIGVANLFCHADHRLVALAMHGAVIMVTNSLVVTSTHRCHVGGEISSPEAGCCYGNHHQAVC